MLADSSLWQSQCPVDAILCDATLSLNLFRLPYRLSLVTCWHIWFCGQLFAFWCSSCWGIFHVCYYHCPGSTSIQQDRCNSSQKLDHDTVKRSIDLSPFNLWQFKVTNLCNDCNFQTKVKQHSPNPSAGEKHLRDLIHINAKYYKIYHS